MNKESISRELAPDGGNVSVWLNRSDVHEWDVRAWLVTRAGEQGLKEFIATVHGWHTLDGIAQARLDDMSRREHAARIHATAEKIEHATRGVERATNSLTEPRWRFWALLVISCVALGVSLAAWLWPQKPD
jgi:hypothetical protein